MIPQESIDLPETGIQIPAPEAKQTVLIVDDHPTNLSVLFDLLKATGLGVRVAASGEAALASVRYAPPDIILLDVMMPGLDGFETCRRLKANPTTEQIPIIFMTALSDPVDEVQGLQLGAVDYITKPIRVETVLARIKTHLALGDLRRRLQKKNRALAETNHALQRRVESLSGLNLIIQTAATTTNLSATLDTIAHIIGTLFEAEQTTLALLNRERTALTIAAQARRDRAVTLDTGQKILLDESPTLAQAITTHHPFIITEPEAIEALPLFNAETGPAPSCLLIVPLLSYGQAIGLITLGLSQPRRLFTSEEVRLAETIAGQLSGIIEVSRLLNEEKRQRKIGESLHDIALALSSSLDQETVLNKILETLGCVIQHDGAAIFLKNQEDLVITSGRNLTYVDLGYRVPIASEDPVARVFTGQETLTLADAPREPTWRVWNDKEPIRSWIGTPLLVEHEVIGVLTVDNFQINAYGPEEAQILQTYAHHAAAAIRNARQVEQTKTALHQAGQLYRIGSTLARSADIEENIGKALMGYLWALDLQQSCLCLFDETEPFYTAYTDEQMEPPTWRISQISAIRQKVLGTSRPLAIVDAPTDPLLTEYRSFIEQRGLKSLLVAPLIIRGQVLGLLSAAALEKQRHFNDQDIDLAQAVAAQMATAVENNRLLKRETQQRHLAEEQNRELDAFAHTVAHNLKNSLGVVVTYADYLFHHADQMRPEFFEESLYTILEASSKGANIVDELLILAGVRKQKITPQSLDMAGIIEQAKQRLSFMIERSKADLILPDTWPVAEGYAPWIEEVWVNYLSNGLKYGGQPPRLEMGATLQADGMIRFWVKDNGDGIPADRQPILFTEFTRLSETKAKGYGLGLSIVRRIIKKLGGQVGVESDGQPGQGTLFYFTLPAVE